MTTGSDDLQAWIGSPQVEPSHYEDANYDTLERFISYWHQIRLVTQCDPDSILEVGIGNSLLSDYLRRRGMKVETLDVDARLGPSVAGSVHAVPFASSSFQVVACFEVLEHLPFSYFQRSLSELKRVSSRYVVLSLPDSRGVWRVEINIPGLEKFRKLIERPLLFGLPAMEQSDEHFWEINRKGWELPRITNLIQDIGLELVSTFRLFEHPYHRFFLLSSKDT